MNEGPDRVVPLEKVVRQGLHPHPGPQGDRADESRRGAKAGRAGDADEHEAEGPNAKRKKITGKTKPGRQADGASTTGGQLQQMDEDWIGDAARKPPAAQTPPANAARKEVRPPRL